MARKLVITAVILVTACLTAGLPTTYAAISRSQELKAQTFTRLTEGIKALRNGNPKQAIVLLEQVTQVSLNSFRAYYYLGRAYSADRQYTRAAEPFTFALELNPTHLQAHVDLGDCYLKLGDIDEALAEYQRARKIQEGFAPSWDGIARAAEARGDDDQAIENFKRSIELNPGYPDASLNLGDLYLRRAQLSEAVELFMKAIAIRPNFAAAYNRLGVAYARQQLGNEAVAALRKAADLEKGNPWHPYTIGLIEMELGYLGQAGRDFDTAIRLDENYLEAYLAKAKLMRQFGNFQAAASILERTRNKPSDDADLLLKVDELGDEINAQWEAYTEINSRLALGDASQEDARRLAELLASAGDYFGASEALRRAVMPESQDGPPDGAEFEADLFKLGYFLLKAGSYEEAELTLRKLRERAPKNVFTVLNLGLSIQGQGKGEAAEKVLREAVELSPEDPAILAALGNSMVMRGNYSGAIAAFEEALESKAAFDWRPRVETILKALRRVQRGSTERATRSESRGGK